MDHLEFRKMVNQMDVSQEERDRMLAEAGIINALPFRDVVPVVNRIAANHQVMPLDVVSVADIRRLRDAEPEFRTKLERQAWNDWCPTTGCIAKFYEPITFHLGPVSMRNAYTPDFLLIYEDGSQQFVEVKGSWKSKNARESRAKLKMAAHLYGFMGKFTGLTKQKGQWKTEEFRGD